MRVALARRFPEETALITYRDGAEPGITAIGNRHVHGVVSIRKKDYAHGVISRTREFVLSYPGEDMERELLDCFANPPERKHALRETGLSVLAAEKVGAPLLEKCIVSYECRVSATLEAGDSTIFVGEIVATHRTGRRARRLFIVGHAGGRPVLRPYAGAGGLPAPPGHEKYPEQVVMIVSRHGSSRPNAMTAGWTMRVSDDPPMMAAFIGRSRHSHGLIAPSREFVCAYPGADMEHEMLYCGTRSGRDVDKFKALGLETQAASKVRAFLLAKALANLECRVVAERRYRRHTIFVARIVAAHVSQKKLPRVYNLGRDLRRRRVFKGLEAKAEPSD